MNKVFFHLGSKHIRLMMVTIALSVVVIASIFSGLVKRNMASLEYLSAEFLSTDTETLRRLALKLDNELEKQPSASWAHHAQLARFYLRMGDKEKTRIQASRAFTSFGAKESCTNRLNPLRRITVPRGYISSELLDFADPQAYWGYEKSGDAPYKISFEVNSIQQCVVVLQTQYSQAPNRFVILSQQVRVQSDSKYRITADVQSQGIDRAWFGISNPWSGSSIPESQTPRTVNYEFCTPALQTTEFVQFVVESGIGEIRISNVTLNKLDSEIGLISNAHC